MEHLINKYHLSKDDKFEYSNRAKKILDIIFFERNTMALKHRREPDVEYYEYGLDALELLIAYLDLHGLVNYHEDDKSYRWILDEE